MTEAKNRVVITSPLYFTMVLVLAVYSLVRNALISIFTGDIEGFIPIVMATLLLWMIWKRSIYISSALIGWALYFIIKYGIVFFGLVLAYGHNGFRDVAVIEVLEKLAFLLAGIIIWIGAYQFVEIHEEFT